MSNKVYIENGDVYLSYNYLKEVGISYHTIKHWSERNQATTKVFAGNAYVLYDEIPTPTQKKLPPINTLLKAFDAEKKRERLRGILTTAKVFEFSKYVTVYESYPTLLPKDVTRFAQRHAVFQCILDMKQKDGLRDLQNLFEAFNQVFTKGYKGKHAFSNAIRKATANGVECVAMDSRIHGNNTLGKKADTDELQFLMGFFTSYGKLSNSQILEKLKIVLDEKGMPHKSLSWVKLHRRKWLENAQVRKSRYGNQEAQKLLPYASLKAASSANIQWQIDGKTLPFYGEKSQRYSLVIVLDNHSKKIVGYAFGKTENTQVIMSAIMNAMHNTGFIPNELVMDKHSFTKTKMFGNIESLFAKKGATITVTINPQQKSFVERYNQYLDKEWSGMWGYTGKGIKSRSIEHHTSNEAMQLYNRKPLTETEIKKNAFDAVYRFNNSPLKDGKTPNENYLTNPHPHPIAASKFDIADLYEKQEKKKISRGQITFEIGFATHEFQLKSEHHAAYNNKTVLVKYYDLTKGIFLYEADNSKPITHLQPKVLIHGAKADQTQDDIEALYRNKGRHVGIESKAQKQIDEVTKKALAKDPELIDRVTRAVSQKQLAQDRQQLEDEYIYGNDATPVKVEAMPSNTIQLTNGAEIFKPKGPKKSSPFTVKNHQIGMVDPSKFFEDDED